MSRCRNVGFQASSRAARLQADDRGVPSEIMKPRIGVILVSLALVLMGTVMVFSASRYDSLVSNESAFHLMSRQIIFASIGAFLCVILARFISFDFWRGLPGYVVYAFAIVLLVLVFVAGDDAYGATRWITIAGFTLQPSEFAKIGFIIVFASLFCLWSEGQITTGKFAFQSTLFVGLPVVFLYATQSDLGTVMVVAVGVIAVLFIGGIRVKSLLLGIAGCVLLVAIALISKPYRLLRFKVWLDPWSDPLDAGFQVIRSYYAFSEGGLFGVGLGGSHEKFYLPMAQNDMIYSIIGEETGFFGAVVVIALFMVFLYCGLRIASHAPNLYGRLLASGLTCMLVSQAFLNMGCTLGLLPLTGKPLPFISAGGSSLLSSFLILGLILAVSVGSNVLTEPERRRNNLNIISVAHDDADNNGQEPMRIRSQRNSISSHEQFDVRRSSLRSSKPSSKESRRLDDYRRNDVSTLTRTGYRSSCDYRSENQRDFRRGSRR